MGLAHSTYPEAEPTGFFPGKNLQGEFPAARAQSNPATVLRDSLHSSHTISANSPWRAKNTTNCTRDENWAKSSILQGIGRAGRDRPQKLQGPEAAWVVSAGTLCRIHWLTVILGKLQTTGRASKYGPSHLPHENPNKYVEMPALHPPFEIGAVFC